MNEEPRPDDDSYIVRVTAVVMTRDESSGGWLALDGCLSRVGVCRLRPDGPTGRNNFLIHGERLKDRQVILESFLKKDLVYTKATPTFHHWQVDSRKCGLTFQCSSDARAFDRGVRRALEDLAEGSTTSSSTLQNEAELGDDDVFTVRSVEMSGLTTLHQRCEDPPAEPVLVQSRLLKQLEPLEQRTSSTYRTVPAELRRAAGLRQQAGRPRGGRRPQGGGDAAAAASGVQREVSHGGRGAAPLRLLSGHVQPRGQRAGPVPGGAGPHPDLHPPGQLHVVRRQPAVPLHVRPGGRLLGPLLLRHQRRALLPALDGAGRSVAAGALHVLLRPPEGVPPLRRGLPLLRRQAQGRGLSRRRPRLQAPPTPQRPSPLFFLLLMWFICRGK